MSLKVRNIYQIITESEYYCKASNVAGSTEVRTILYVTKSKKHLLDYY